MPERTQVLFESGGDGGARTRDLYCDGAQVARENIESLWLMQR